MLNSKYQRVGVLAGLLIFFGSWLTGYYNSWVWAAATIASVMVAFWVALEAQSDEELGARALKGFMTGIIAAIVARVAGLLAMVWAFDSWSSPVTTMYDSLSDAFRVFFNGDLWTSILVILGTGAIGAFVAYAMPYFTAEREEE